MYMNNIVNTQD